MNVLEVCARATPPRVAAARNTRTPIRLAVALTMGSIGERRARLRQKHHTSRQAVTRSGRTPPGACALFASLLSPICPDRWVGPRPTDNVNGVTSPLACIFEGCPAGTRAIHDSSVCDPRPVGSHLLLTTYTCQPDIIVE